MTRMSYIAAVLLFVTAAAGAQNLNPTVEVTNVYSSSAKDITKPVQEMAVPDSVTRFNLKLDYSVFDSPYKGSYEFSPYSVEYTPTGAVPKGNQFYLRAGAGYRLHPEFEAVWSPVLWNKVRLDLTARHNSFFGNYRGLALKEGTKKGKEIKSLVWDKTEASFGYDAVTDLGVKALYPWSRGEATFSASYTNLSGKDYLIVRSLNGVRLDGSVRSVGTEGFRYEASAGWNHWGDYGGHLSPYKLVEDKVDVRTQFGFPMRPGGEIFARVDFTMDFLKKDLPLTAGLLAMTPGYRFGLGDWYFDLGVRFDVYMGAERFKSHQFVFPAASVSYTLLDGSMVVYASATGGTDIHSYSDVVLGNRIFSPIHPVLPGCRLLDNTVERVRATVGLRGQVRHRFQYHFRAGYARVANDLLDGIVLKNQEDGTDLDFPLPGTGYARPYHLGFADLDVAWISDNVKVDGTFSLKATNLKETQVFAPALFSGSLRGAYVWNKRITAGLSIDFSSSRTAKVSADTYYRVPGYADIGIFGEYQIDRMFGVWLKIGNLLNSTNQVTPLYTCCGTWFSTGLTLTF